MDSITAWWAAIALGPLLTGITLVCALIAPRRLEAPFAAVGLAGFGAAVLGIARVSVALERSDASLYAFAIMLAAGGGGYALASTSLDRLAAPRLLAPPGPTGDPDPRIAIIVTRCVEPRTYSASATAQMIRSLTDEGLVEPSVGSLPFLFFAQKARYRGAGGESPASAQLASIAARLQAALADVPVVVSAATCAGAERLGARVSDAVRAGHRDIIVLELSLARTGLFESARSEAESLTQGLDGVSVRFMSPLEPTDSILAMLADRIVSAAVSDPDTGVVLVGRGQPPERTRLEPGFAEAETTFISRLRAILAERGLTNERVRLAWDEWGEPSVTSEVRHLVAGGCQRVLVAPATQPVDTLASTTDLVAAVKRARIDEETPITMLPAWGDDDHVAASLRDALLPALSD